MSLPISAQKEEKKENTMTTTCLIPQEKVYRIEILREETCRVGQRLARYRFCICRFAHSEYYAEIVLGDERAATHLGEDLAAAGRLFDLLVRGTVTPCTLSDIMQDIKNAQNPFTSIKDYDII